MPPSKFAMALTMTVMVWSMMKMIVSTWTALYNRLPMLTWMVMVTLQLNHGIARCPMVMSPLPMTATMTTRTDGGT